MVSGFSWQKWYFHESECLNVIYRHALHFTAHIAVNDTVLSTMQANMYSFNMVTCGRTLTFFILIYDCQMKLKFEVELKIQSSSHKPHNCEACRL